MDLANRVQVAQSNLEAAARDAGSDWVVRVSREGGGYKVVFEKGDRKVIRTQVDEAILEDTVSDARRRLVMNAASDLESPR